MMLRSAPLALIAALLVACGGGGGGTTANAPAPPSQEPGGAPHTQGCQPLTPPATPAPGAAPQPASGLSVPSGFTISVIGNVRGARELAFAPNGDLFVGTGGSSVYVIQNAEAQPATPRVFVNVNDAPAAGVALSLESCSLYIGVQSGVYRVPYTVGDSTAQGGATKIAAVRTIDNGGHITTSVIAIGNTLYASVGSSCDACHESDPTRATIQMMKLDGTGMSARAVHIRNAIALAMNPATNSLWAGDAGQDQLPQRHPYEFFDAVTDHTGVANYGWPDCEENHHAYTAGADCSATVVPAVEFPAYSTAVGAAFYPATLNGTYAFPAQYLGGAFVALHGSWHTPDGCNVAPHVAFVPMNGDTPQNAVDWNDPRTQWSDFVQGFQPGCSAGTRIGRPVGVAVGPQGDLFVADDLSGNIYRIRAGGRRAGALSRSNG